MSRSKAKLLESRSRLVGAIDALRAEIAEIDNELAGYRKGAPLTDALFWSMVVPILTREEDGLTSAEVQNKLNAHGIATNSVALRTFLSRNKAKGRLVIFNHHTPPKWKVAASPSQDTSGSANQADRPAKRLKTK